MLERFGNELAAAGASGNTVANYRSQLKGCTRWLAQRRGGEDSCVATLADLDEYRRNLAERCRPATVNLFVYAARAFGRWAVKQGLAATDPAAGLRCQAEGPEPVPRWLTGEEQRRLVHAVQREAAAGNTEHGRQRAVRDMAVLLLMLHAGLRVGEVVALRWEDVELSARRGRVTVRAGKGGKCRQVPLNAEVRRALLWYLEVRGQDPGPVFPGAGGGGLTTRAVTGMVSRYARAAGVAANPNVLRHTFCHELVERGGVALDSVAILVGHTTLDGRPNVRTTMRYAVPRERELERAVESIEWH